MGARMLRTTIADFKHGECQRFLNTFVRGTKPELPEIPIKEHVVRVVQTPAERALYLQEAIHGNRKTLLQFCSHHCFDDSAEDNVDTSASETVERLIQRKRETKARLESEVA